MSALTRRLLFPLHLAVLASLHAVLASARAARLVVRLASLVPLPRLRQHEAVTPADDLKRGRWKKLPKHLAVILAPARAASDIRQAVQDKVEQLRKLLGWTRELGIATLSVYDETGARSFSLRPLRPLTRPVFRRTSRRGGFRGVDCTRDVRGGAQFDEIGLRTCPTATASSGKVCRAEGDFAGRVVGRGLGRWRQQCVLSTRRLTIYG